MAEPKLLLHSQKILMWQYMFVLYFEVHFLVQVTFPGKDDKIGFLTVKAIY